MWGKTLRECLSQVQETPQLRTLLLPLNLYLLNDLQKPLLVGYYVIASHR